MEFCLNLISNVGKVTFGHDTRGQSRPKPCSSFLPSLPFVAYQVSYDNMDATESRTMKARREGRFSLAFMSRSVV